MRREELRAKNADKLMEASRDGKQIEPGDEAMNRDSGARKRKNSLWRVVARVLHLRSEEGSAVAEMAWVMVPLMTIITGAASFGVAFYFFQQLSNATSTAVQLVAADEGLVTDPCAVAQTSVQSSLPNFTAGNFSYSLSVTPYGGGNPTTYSSTASGSSVTFTCTGAGSGGPTTTAEYPNEPVVLTVSYSYNWIPIVGFSPKAPLKAVQGAIAE
ncbi:MAG: TadE/TadG family type IV pilus assembly protein [Terracidiphilus sp.]